MGFDQQSLETHLIIELKLHLINPYVKKLYKLVFSILMIYKLLLNFQPALH
jgi:hypothetical protein